MSDDVTSPEVRDMVNKTLDLLHRQVGSVRIVRGRETTESVIERLEMIRQRAQLGRGKTAGES